MLPHSVLILSRVLEVFYETLGAVFSLSTCFSLTLPISFPEIRKSGSFLKGECIVHLD